MHVLTYVSVSVCIAIVLKLNGRWEHPFDSTEKTSCAEQAYVNNVDEERECA